MKGHATLWRSPELGPHHQVQFIAIPKTPLLWWEVEGLIPLQGIQSAYSNLH